MRAAVAGVTQSRGKLEQVIVEAGRRLGRHEERVRRGQQHSRHGRLSLAPCPPRAGSVKEAYSTQRGQDRWGR